MNGFKVRRPAVGRRLKKRVEGIEPSSQGLEGLRSTIELHPREAVSGSRA
jgi:hypothetical protein